MHKKNKFNLFYSVLQYTPNPIRRESIIVGIVFHIPSLKLSTFKHIKNRNRIKSFDDEYDSDFINMMFESIDYEFNSSKLDEHDDRFSEIDSDSFLFKSTAYYVNEFRFLPVESIMTDEKSLDNDMIDLERTYLYYDKPKGQRITTSEVKALMKRQLTFYRFDLKKEKRSFKDSIIKEEIFDFSNSKNAFKAISFDKSRKKDLSNELKVFLYDLSTQKEKIEHLSIYIIVDNSLGIPENSDEFYQIYSDFKNIVKSKYNNVFVIPLSDFPKVISTLT